jgi:hypothetical protein
MNQKTGIVAFAVLIAFMMILSSFAGFLMRGGDEVESVATSQVSVKTFGIPGTLVDLNFNKINDLLEMSPESTVTAYWIDLDKSENLTDAAREALPQAIGLTYGSKIYQNKIERLGVSYFNDSSVEFHWIKPYAVSYSSLVVPYDGFMMIPQSSDYYIALSKPVFFGPQEPLKSVLDVVSGGLPTDKFTLPEDEAADLQVSSLADGKTSPSGNYQEFYLGVSKTDSVYALTAKYLKPDSATAQKIKEISDRFGLSLSTKAGATEISGTIGPAKLKDVLTAFLKP